MKIAVCITTRNRRDVFNECLKHWLNHLPLNGSIFIVDDGSDIPVPKSDFRFEQNVGIAVAKNKCLELAERFDHIFLVDDDIWPTNSNWWKPYVDSKLNHACLTFNRRLLGATEDFLYFEKPCGVLLYFKKVCLEVVGGFDTNFSFYGYEHVNLSDRIYNVGLTPQRYVDTHNSLYNFKVLDFLGLGESSVPKHLRAMHLYYNESKYKSKINSSYYFPYK